MRLVKWMLLGWVTNKLRRRLFYGGMTALMIAHPDQYLAVQKTLVDITQATVNLVHNVTIPEPTAIR